MRVGINTLFLVPGDVGGTEIYLRQNLLEMVDQDPITTFVLFVTRDNEELFVTELGHFANVEYVRLPIRAAIRPVRILAEQFLLPRLVSRAAVDVLWSPGYTAPLRCCCPQVVTIHDLQYKSHPDDLSRLERLTLDFLVGSACRVCKQVIAVSEFSRQEILHYKFAPGEKVVAVLEGVDPFFAKAMGKGALNRAFPELKKPYILCVAHTYPHKNVHVLVDAFAQLADNIPHDLVLVGKGRRGEGRVQRSLAALSCQGRVHRLQDLDLAQLKVLYQGADCFVLPSLYEGFGLPVLEAMLARTPVITSRKASLPEVAGPHSLYVEDNTPEAFGRAIAEELSWSALQLDQWLERAFDWASSFTWQRSARQTLEILLTTAGKK